MIAWPLTYAEYFICAGLIFPDDVIGYSNQGNTKKTSFKYIERENREDKEIINQIIENFK